MRVFIAGGTGVIGRPAVRRVVEAGHEVVAVARRTEAADQLRAAGAHPLALDLFDAAAVEDAVAGADVVVNLATSIPSVSRAGRRRAWATNDRLRRDATANLVAAARAHEVARFVQESITFPYVDSGADWIDESTPRACNWATASSADAERQVLELGRAEGVDAVVLRFAQLYAPAAAHTIAFDRLARCRLNPFVGDPDTYVSSLHADDAGSAVAAAVGLRGGVYNVADDEPLTRREAGAVVAAANGVPRVRTICGLPLVAPTVLRDLMRSQRVSNAAFREASGWRPDHPTLRGSWPSGR